MQYPGMSSRAAQPFLTHSHPAARLSTTLVTPGLRHVCVALTFQTQKLCPSFILFCGVCMLSLSLFDFPSPTFTSSYKPKMCLLSGDSKLAGSVDVRACFCLFDGLASVQSVPRPPPLHMTPSCLWVWSWISS